MRFYQRLTLNQWMWRQFGVDNLEKLPDELKKPELEEIDEEGVSGFAKLWKALYPHKQYKRSIPDDKFLHYDLNIVTHLHVINEKRAEKIRLKYFQWLSLMFVEYYLDLYFNDRVKLLQSMNNWSEHFANQFRDKYANAEVSAYIESDLNKIALWNATGSGKTILMHINYMQYQHYGKLADGASFILLTPKEGLSIQHIDEFTESDIDAKLYDKNEPRRGTDKNRIIILENTKLADKDGDKTVSVKRFGSKNVVFVDEGHRGSSGDKWQGFRDDLCRNGFSFEYSATFGQAAEAAGDKLVYDRYAKCILFDYSYKFFYRDGYGKDYNIINLEKEGDPTQRTTYLTGCLLAFYQQKKLFATNKEAFEPFNIPNPLFVFVGASVNAVRTENKREISDVLDILIFLRVFFENKSVAVSTIDRILSGISGLWDNKNRDIFIGAFPFLTETAMSAEAIYLDIFRMIFNSPSPSATLHIENLKGINGEIQLRLGGNLPFGIINVGDDAKFLKLCGNNGFNTANITFTGGSLFQSVTKPDSPINLLIGAKKFTEGWNCWRVSTMGLMNVGRSEGSEIIRLFGRGVRLKGYGMSLKRSKSWQLDVGVDSLPKHIAVVETLNVFGVRADYMKQFKEFLEREGVPGENDKPITITLPVIKNLPNRRLRTIRIKDGVEFKMDAPNPVLAYDRNVGKVLLDCYAKVQFESSGNPFDSTANKAEGKLPEEAIHLFDKEKLWMELVRYKKQKGRNDLNIPKSFVKSLLYYNDWYILLIPAGELICINFDDVRRMEKIALTLLRKYLDRFYYVSQKNWESKTVGYELAELTSEDFPTEYVITTTNREIETWLMQVAEELERCKGNVTKGGQLLKEKTKYPLTIFGTAGHLYNPLIYKAKNGIEIEASSCALNDSEKKFVYDLDEFIKENFNHYPEAYLLRNPSKKGVGFFNNEGFYPDFILWIISGDKQNIIFIDPHGMRNEGINSPKVQLACTVGEKITSVDCTLTSVILSATSYADLSDNNISKEDWNEVNVIFMEDKGYIAQIMEKAKIPLPAGTVLG